MDNQIKANACQTHVVFKAEDAERYLTAEQLLQMRNLLNAISLGREGDGKEPSPFYYVCNKDEPYANEVEEAILEGERGKEK